MEVIISNAWLNDDPGALEGYVAVYEQFGELHRQSPGFVSRELVIDDADPTHLVNIRRFESAGDYAALVAHPGYRGWIERLSEFVQPRNPEKVVATVVVEG